MRTRIALVVAALALSFVAVSAATDPIADGDVGWIVAAGRWSLAHGAVPRTNMFSFTAPDAPWIMHEWLLGPIYALGVRALGPGFLALVALVATLGLGALVAARSFASLKHPIAGAVAAALVFVEGFDRLRSARPLAWSIVLASVLAVVVFRPRLDRRHAVGAVLLTLVWTNIHGSFPLALVLLGAAAFDATERRGHFLAIAASGLATFVNPYGLRLHALVVGYTFGTGTMRAVHERVLEYAPILRPGYHDVVAPVEIGVLVAIAVLAADGLRRREARGAAGVALLLCVSAFLQARNAGMAIVLGSLLVQAHVARRIPPRDVPPIARFVALPAVVIGLALLVPTLARRPRDEWIDPMLGGPSFARLTRKLPDGARTFVPFRSGGLLLQLAAERGVTTFYDPRNDCYPEEIARFALALKDGELPAEGLAPLLARFGTEWAIVPDEAFVHGTRGDPRWSRLAVLAPALREWTPIATDGGWTLYSARK